jgi:SIR2-like domain
MSFTHDQINRRAIEHLDTVARKVYADMILDGQTPIAVVGSGLSVPYGGISWTKAAEMGRKEALRQLKYAADPKNKAQLSDAEKEKKRLKIARACRSIEAFNEKPGNDSEELYLALQIAKDGIAVAHECCDQEDKPGELFGDFMAKLFGNEGFRLKEQAIGRIGIDPKSKECDVFRSGIKQTVSFDTFLARFYSFPMLERIANTPVLLDVVELLRKEFKEMNGSNAETLPPDRRSLVALLLAARRGMDSSFDSAEVLRCLDEVTLTEPSCLRPVDDTIREIHDKLGIKRFITLNYDYELEMALMLDDVRAINGAQYGFKEALRDNVIEYEPQDATDQSTSSGGVTRRFSDGMAASSDVYQAKAAARLFEFALNSPDYRLQIVHQHGRADIPASMVLTDDDLNQLYRHDRYSRTTLEQALDVILTGNPILFIGLGLTEIEITRALRQLVGEGRATLDDPAFAIMAFDKAHSGKDYDDKGGVKAWRRQVGLLRQYGIHLFDAGHPRHGMPAFNAKLAALDALAEALKAYDPERKPRAKKWNGSDKRIIYAIKVCGDAKVAAGIKLDEQAFKFLLDLLKNEEFRIITTNYHLLIDYLGYLKSKHYTQCLITEINRLHDGARRRFVENTYQSLAAIGPIPKALIVDDDSVREASALKFRPQSVRHAVEPSGTIDQRFHQNINDAADNILTGLDKPGASFLSGELGVGKGATLNLVLSRLKAEASFGSKELPTEFCYINCSMALEFDSAIFQLLRFVHGVAFPSEGTPLRERLNELLQALLKRADADADSPPPLIVLSGIERLLDAQSKPLTPELELVVKMLLHPKVIAKGWHVLIAGTPSALAWVKKISEPTKETRKTREFINLKTNCVSLKTQNGGLLCRLHSYASERVLDKARDADAVRNDLDRWKLLPSKPNVPNGARSPASIALIAVLLERWHDFIPSPGGVEPMATRVRAELDRQILQNLAYVGQPVARSVLPHMPDIRKAASKVVDLNKAVVDRDIMPAIIDACDRLVASGLAMSIVPFPNEPGEATPDDQRLALPRIVLAELRERFGVRSGEEQLSNSFTLTLASSMPTDLVIPDRDVARTLAEVVGHLRAAWKDAVLTEDAQKALDELRAKFPVSSESLAPLRAESAELMERIDNIERLAFMAAAPMEEALRAASAVVRGFFSAATLVSTDPAIGARKDEVTGECEIHRKRLDEMLERTREVRNIKCRLARELTKLPGLGAAEPAGYAERLVTGRAVAHPALYSGELIWLLNEAGVVAMLQGNLKAADRSLREAEYALERFKGMGARHTWRRLTINRAFLNIERGRIAEARTQLDEVLGCINSPRLKIVNDAIRAESDNEICEPIAIGYLGLVDSLGGHFGTALTKYDVAIKGLISSGQQRALALFYWRRGMLNLAMDDSLSARDNLLRAIAEAENGRQIDVAWRARLTMTELQRDSDPAFVATVFREAHAYSIAMKMPRLQAIALRREAEWRMQRDDLTVAAALATQSMQCAARNGMTLMRISLRTLMGSIMLRQGDASGEFLLKRAIHHADRIGYQLQVNKAREVLLETKALKGTNVAR